MNEPITNYLSTAILATKLVSCRFNILHGGSLVSQAKMRWDSSFAPEWLRIFGFEPDTDRAKIFGAIRGSEAAERHVYHKALWSHETSVTLRISETLGASSVFQHNFDEISRWSEFNLGKDIEKIEVEAVRADDWAWYTGVDYMDFAYLNVEGSELNVLKGMDQLLKGIVGIIAEVNLIPTYFTGAPVFADVDIHMRSRGFSLFGFLPGMQYVGRGASPVNTLQPTMAGNLVEHDPSRGRQILQGKAIYFRDPLSSHWEGQHSAVKVLKLACLAEAYGQIEFAFEIANWCRDNLLKKVPAASSALSEAIEKAASLYNAPGPRGEPSEVGETSLELAEMTKLHAAQIERMQSNYSILLEQHLWATGVLDDLQD